MKNATRYQKQTRVMRNAWRDYKSYDNQISSFETERTFGECLTECWMVENMTKQDIYSSINELTVSQIMNILITNDIDKHTILIAVSEKSKGFQSDVAKKAIQYNRMSDKQAWCIAYEFKNIA